MRVDQLLATVAPGDAVSNQALAMRALLRQWGYTSDLYAENVHPALAGDCLPLASFDAGASAAVILHLSIGSQATDAFRATSGKRMLVYHNITPSHYFAPYSEQAYQLTRQGREVLAQMPAMVDVTLGDSAYNCEELAELGFRDPRVMPILVDFDALSATAPDRTLMERHGHGLTNLLFVGRVVPNKRQEDVIRAFSWYNRLIERRSRLFLVGSFSGMEAYHDDLLTVVGDLALEDHVVFAGHVSPEQLVAYYRLASVFLCMSEHEGFCVPLLEAMHFEVPVLALAAAGVPGTLASAGIQVLSRDFPVIAETAHLLVSDADLRRQVIAHQKERLAAFTRDGLAGRFEGYVRDLLEC